MNTYEDMAGDAGFINISDNYDGYLISELEDLAHGVSSIYPGGALELRGEPLVEGPVVPDTVMARAQAALDADSQPNAEKVLDDLCEFWFQGEDDD